MLVEAVPGRRWLDLGGGRRPLPEDLSTLSVLACRSARSHVVVDLDFASLRSNPAGMKVCADAFRLPFRQASFDLVTANMVMEHVDDPAGVLDEVSRVLTPDGVFLVHTPSAGQYEILAARLLRLGLGPRVYRRLVASWDRRDAEDIFPTRYMFNTLRTIRRLAKSRIPSDMLVCYAETPPLLARWKPLWKAELALRKLLPRSAKAAMIVRLVKNPSL